MSQTVYTLLCERDLEMALITLPKIVTFLASQQQLHIIDDGSLSVKSIDTLKSLSPEITVITLKEREDFVLEAIKKFPNCVKFRKEYAPAYKLIDIPLLAQKSSPRFTYTDSDIIYLRNCNPYFQRNVNTYLKTDAIKISVKLQNVFFKYKWSVPYKFNSGYFSFDVKDYDMSLIEYFVSRPDVRNIPWVIEQTGWALQFGQAGRCYSPDEDEFVCRETFAGPGEKTLAIHLIAKLKGKVSEWSVPQTKAFENKTDNAKFHLSRNANLLDWAKKSAHRFLPKF